MRDKTDPLFSEMFKGLFDDLNATRDKRCRQLIALAQAGLATDAEYAELRELRRQQVLRSTR